MVFCLIALFKPSVGILLFFSIILCYPSWLLWQKLPLNAGFDDLFIVCLFIGSIIWNHHNINVKWPFVAASVFCSIALLGDLSSLLMGVELSISEVAKRFLKSIGIVCLTFSLCSTKNRVKTIEHLFGSLIFGCTIGALFVLIYSIYPNIYNPFQVPAWLFTDKGMSEYQIIGPFLTHDRAGGVLGFAGVLVYFVSRIITDKFKKLIYMLLSCFFFISILVSGSRSGYVFIFFPLFMSIFFSKKRIAGILIAAFLFITGLFAIHQFDYLGERLMVTKKQWETNDLEGRTAGRLHVWMDSLSKVNVRWLVFGDGFSIEETHPHNNYIAILKNMGLAGVIFWTVYYYRTISRVSYIKKYDSNVIMAGLFTGIFWAYLGYFFFFITSTPVMWSPVRYIDFFLMTIVHLRHSHLTSGIKNFDPKSQKLDCYWKGVKLPCHPFANLKCRKSLV